MALLRRGYDAERIARMYDVPIEAVHQAADLESSLEAA